MKKFFLTEDSYSFYTSEKTMLATIFDGSIKNLSSYIDNDNINVHNIDNFVSKNETVNFDLIVIDDDSIFHPFYISTNLTDGKLITTVTCDKDISDDEISYIKSIIEIDAPKNMIFDYIISDSHLYHTSVDTLNIDLASWNSSIAYSPDIDGLYFKNNFICEEPSSFHVGDEDVLDEDNIPF